MTDTAWSPARGLREEPMHCVQSMFARAGSSRTGMRGRRGFTLLESLMALVIIGVGVLAFVDAQSAFTHSNNWSSQSATGMLLANEVREFSRKFARHDPVTGLALNSGVLQGWGRETGEVSTADLNDLDDLDGVTFGIGGTFAGPIDALGFVIPEISLDGVVRQDEAGQRIPMQGWTQRVIVEKVDPYNTGTVRADSYEQNATGSLPRISVESFPLRVTVIVEYQPVGSTQAQEITRLVWISPTN